ncbi:MAG: hypothetical protein RR295_00665 [Oscillospiraceae bacterium]
MDFPQKAIPNRIKLHQKYPLLSKKDEAGGIFPGLWRIQGGGGAERGGGERWRKREKSAAIFPTRGGERGMKAGVFGEIGKKIEKMADFPFKTAAFVV